MAARIGNVSYRLELPAASKAHLVFHVSLLKKVFGQHPTEVEFPIDVGVEEKGCEPEMIVLSLLGWQGQTRGLNPVVKWRECRMRKQSR